MLLYLFTFSSFISTLPTVNEPSDHSFVPQTVPAENTNLHFHKPVLAENTNLHIASPLKISLDQTHDLDVPFLDADSDIDMHSEIDTNNRFSKAIAFETKHANHDIKSVSTDQALKNPSPVTKFPPKTKDTLAIDHNLNLYIPETRGLIHISDPDFHELLVDLAHDEIAHGPFDWSKKDPLNLATLRSDDGHEYEITQLMQHQIQQDPPNILIRESMLEEPKSFELQLETNQAYLNAFAEHEATIQMGGVSQLPEFGDSSVNLIHNLVLHEERQQQRKDEVMRVGQVLKAAAAELHLNPKNLDDVLATVVPEKQTFSKKKQALIKTTGQSDEKREFILDRKRDQQRIRRAKVKSLKELELEKTRKAIVKKVRRRIKSRAALTATKMRQSEMVMHPFLPASEQKEVLELVAAKAVKML